LISAVLNGFVPFVTGRFFDALIHMSQGVAEVKLLTPWILFFILWCVIQFLVNIVDWYIQKVNRHIDNKSHFGIQAAGLAHLLRLPMSFHKKERSNGLIQKISDVSWRVASMGNTVLSLVPSFISVFVGILLSFTLNIVLASVLLVGMVVYAIILFRLVLPTAELNKKGHEVWNKEWDAASASVQQVENVKQATAEDYEEKKITEGLAKKTYGIWISLANRWSTIGGLQRLVVFVVQVTIFVLAIGYIQKGILTVGELITFNGYALMILGPIVSLGYNWQNIQNSIIAAALAEDIFGAETEVYNKNSKEKNKIVEGVVEFRDVTFRYAKDQPIVLDKVSFTVAKGEVVALVGKTGVGKSSLIGLLGGYFFPTEGEVLIDGVSTRELNLIDLRSSMATVPQEVALFNDSIKNNIKYGSFSVSDKTLLHAAKEAHVDEFVEKFPEKYEQEVGDRGVKLSVGQKQRVAIARAMLRDPKILILDEPTSALDIETEHFITASLEKLMKGRTTFIVAHRLSTVRRADKILVIEEGKIVEEGNHETLIKKRGGVYKKLHELHIGLA
jgi:ABC-type multidrug transport system fused ATPase/permease subunit